jgi:photosystem II stability/assembly factor-like uncharacterized protein
MFVHPPEIPLSQCRHTRASVSPLMTSAVGCVHGLRRRRAACLLVVTSLLSAGVVTPNAPEAHAMTANWVRIQPTEVLATPRPVSNLSNLSCPTANTCVTASWPASRTTDGGQTWQTVKVDNRSDSGDWLPEVSCVADLDCYATDDTRRLKHTIDGGTSWTTIDVPTAIWNIGAITCLGSTFCIASGQRYNTGLISFISTVDGGRSWTTTHTELQGGVSELACANNTFCIASLDSTSLLATTDGGISWSERSAYHSMALTDLDCADATTCLAVSWSGIAVLTPSTNHWYDAWQPSHWEEPALSCVSATACLVFGTDSFRETQTRLVNPSTGTLVEVILPAQAGLVAVADCVGSTCTAIGAPRTFPASSSEISITSRSTDGGHTWSAIGNPTRVERHIGMACLSELTCIVVGDTGERLGGPGLLSIIDAGGLVRRTTDGGRTWTRVTVPPDVRQLFSIDCTTTTCVASGWSAAPQHQSTVLFSPDAGATWSEASIPLASITSPIVSCIEATCFVVAVLQSISIIFRSLDGGRTWAQVHQFAGHGQIHCSSAMRCLLDTYTSEGPRLFRTTDAATTWDLVAVPPSLEYTGVDTCVRDRCYAHLNGLLTRVAYTTDLGQTWITPSTQHFQEEIACGGATCLAIAGHGRISVLAHGDFIEPSASVLTSLDIAGPKHLECPSERACFVLASGGSERGTTVVRLDLAQRSLVSVEPARLLDSRSGSGLDTIDHQHLGVGLVRGGTTYVLPVAGRGGVPIGVSTAIVNVTSTEPQGPGFVTVFPCNVSRPNSSNLNYVAGQTVANAVTTRISANGTICVYTLATTHLIVDVNAYVSVDLPSVTSVEPARLLDSRSGSGLDTTDHQHLGVGSVLGGTTYVLPVARRGGVADGVSTVIVNVTATEPQAAGYVTVFPCDVSRPNSSNLNYIAGQTVANAVTTRVSANGTICLYTLATTHLIVDVNAYANPNVPNLVSVEPARLLDSRSGSGLDTTDHQHLGVGPVRGGTTYVLPVAGRGGVPIGVSTAIVNVTSTEPQGPGFLTVYPCDVSRPNSSTLNYIVGQTVANAVTTRISANGTICVYTLATTHLIVDVNAYSNP